MIFRSLTDRDFTSLHNTLQQAYADYAISARMTESEFRGLLSRDNVQFDLSVGAFVEGKMVAFTINGLGRYQGQTTVFDTGTGVLPEYRRQGVGRRMFEFLLPRLIKSGAKQYVLEVITDNHPAIQLYRGFGFEIIRKFDLVARDKIIEIPQTNPLLVINEINIPDWQILKSFWDFAPSWFNSPEVYECNASGKYLLGAFLDNFLVGYGVVTGRYGAIMQIAVDRDFRRRGIGSALLAALQCKTNLPLRINNIDVSSQSMVAFCQALGFTRIVSQYEMRLMFARSFPV